MRDMNRSSARQLGPTAGLLRFFFVLCLAALLALVGCTAHADPARRKVLYNEAQHILACQGPVVHLAYGTLFTALRSSVQGFRISPTRSLLGLRDVVLAP